MKNFSKNKSFYLMQIRTGCGFQFQIPSLLYNYKIIEEIGKDDYSALLKVQDMNTQEYYRAKIYSKVCMQRCGDGLVKMIHNEIRILRSINHQNISHLHEYFNIKNDYGEKLTVLIEDYYANGTLREYISGRRFIDENEKKRIEYEILQAIDYLHQNQIAHLNIRPENIYLDRELHPKLSNFGAAIDFRRKMCYDYSYYTFYIIGKELMNYTAPFNFIFDYYIISKYKADIWSFGILLFYITEHALPFNTSDELKKLSNETLRTSKKDVMKIVRHCLKIDLTHRPGSQQLLNDQYFQ